MVSDTSGVRHLSARLWPARRRPKTGNDRPLLGTVAPPALEGSTPGRRWCL